MKESPVVMAIPPNTTFLKGKKVMSITYSKPTSSHFKDLTGQRFGRLTVVVCAGTRRMPSGQMKSYWECLCDCGHTTIVQAGNLKKKGYSTVSCGCRLRDWQQGQEIHGRKPVKLWTCWMQMKSRCQWLKNKRFSHYGGRGISVCKEWNSSYETFRDWAIANGWSPDLQIDRRNNDGNYEPGNCRWVTKIVQQRNRGNNRRITINNVTHCISEWAEISGIKASCIAQRLRVGWIPYAAIFSPIRRWK